MYETTKLWFNKVTCIPNKFPFKYFLIKQIHRLKITSYKIFYTLLNFVTKKK